MGDLSLEKVSETYLDVLKEIGNIGAGNAMTALSQMLNCKVDMKVRQVKLCSVQSKLYQAVKEILLSTKPVSFENVLIPILNQTTEQH